MAIEEIKERLHQLVDSTDNELLLGSLLDEVEEKLHTAVPHVLEGLSLEDYNELAELVNEDPEKDTISYEELKSSLGRWFTK
jgi:hypothetical protein